MKNINLILSCSFCVLLFLNSVQAKNRITNAATLQAFPSPRFTQIQPLDNSIGNLTLQKIIKTKLSKREHRDASKAPLILMSRKSSHQKQTKAWVNIYKSAKCGLLNGRYNQRESSSIASQYRHGFTLENRLNGLACWQA
jgi:hypothetical protein